MATEQRSDVVGAAHLVLASGATPLHPEEAVFEAMLAGWQAQQRSRCLRETTIHDAVRLVRRFASFTNEYPWRWTPADVEDWTSELVSEPRPIAHSTVRAYQQTLARFLDYVVDRSLRLGGGVRGALRAGAGADLPRVEHGRAPRGLRGPAGQPAVHTRGVAALLGLCR